MSCEIPQVAWGFGTEAAINLNVLIAHPNTPKQLKCFNEKKHKNRSQTFILHYKTWAMVKERKYVLVHAVKCIIAPLAKSVLRF